jgi:hypothetical protein
MMPLPPAVSAAQIAFSFAAAIGLRPISSPDLVPRVRARSIPAFYALDVPDALLVRKRRHDGKENIAD